MYGDDTDSDCECELGSDRFDANVTSAGAYSRLDDTGMFTNPVYPLPEQKIVDFDQLGATPPASLAYTTINNNPSMVTAICLNTMVRGFGNGNMTGNKITVKRVSYRYGINPVALTFGQCIRVVLVWDKQPNGNLPIWTDVFDDAGTGVGSDFVLSHINIDKRRRFVVLKDDNFPIPGDGAAVSYNMSGSVVINKDSVYVDGAGSRVVPTSGALFLLYICYNNGALILGRWRVRYFDS